MKNYYLHHGEHEDNEEVFMFSAQAEKKLFRDFSCVSWLILAFRTNHLKTQKRN